MKWISMIFSALMLSQVVLQAQSTDSRYLQIYHLIQEGDRFDAAGELDRARVKYTEARTALRLFRAGNPNWNEKAVQFRLRYLDEKLGSPSESAPQETRSRPATPALNPAELSAQIEGLREMVTRLESEKGVLEAKLREALSARPAAIDPRELAKAQERIRSLEKERDVLQLTLQEAKGDGAERLAIPDDHESELRRFREGLAEQSEVLAGLKQEKTILEKQVESMRTELAAGNAFRVQNESLKSELERLQAEAKKSERAQAAFEKEKRDLEKKLASATAAAAKRNRTNAATDTAVDLSRELAALRARLEVLEARKEPYTAQELALMSRPKPELNNVELVSNAAAAPQRPASTVPGDAAALFSEAGRAFTAGRFQEAESKFVEVLRNDPQNVVALGNLAASQVEQNKLADAEGTLKRALAADPNDSFSLSLLGFVRFRQDKFQEAFESLSRAAKLDPHNPETQNYLGITLSHLGQRGPAEAALRKAISLQPGYASAHHNLAIIYATQKPPFLELAKWHYEKALDSGHKTNPDLEKMIEKRD